MGDEFTYIVPDGKYTSTISQEDADDQADEDLEANAQWVANNTAGVGCQIYTLPIWEADENSPRRCLNGATQIQMRDVNPNSPPNQTIWMDLEENIDNCSLESCNIQTNCSPGVIQQGSMTVQYQYRKCINGVCENGVRVYLFCEFLGYIPSIGMEGYRQWYHYEFSDNTHSLNYFYDDYGCQQ
jgi:hypothetical protein